MIIVNPTLSAKLLCLVSRNHLVAFSITKSAPTKTDVQDFLLSAFASLRSKFGPKKYLFHIADNAPKNKFAQIMKLLARLGVTVLFICPGTPDQNMIEHIFFFLKKMFSTWKSLILLNLLPNANQVLQALILLSLSKIGFQEFEKAGRKHLRGLRSSANTTKNFENSKCIYFI